MSDKFRNVVSTNPIYVVNQSSSCCGDPDGESLFPLFVSHIIFDIHNAIRCLPIKREIKNQIINLIKEAEIIPPSYCDNDSFSDEDSDWGFFCSEVSLYYVDESNPYESVHGCWELYFTECYEVDGYGYGCVDSFIDEPTHLPLLPSYVFDKQSLKVLFGQEPIIMSKVNVYSKFIVIINKYNHYITALDDKGKLQYPSQSNEARTRYGDSKEFTIDNIPFYPILTGKAISSYSRGSHSGVEIIKKVKDPDGNDFDLTFCIDLPNFLSIVKEGGIGQDGEFLDQYVLGGVSGTGISLVKAGTPASDELIYVSNSYVGETPRIDYKHFFRNQNGSWLLPYKFKKLSTYGYFFCEAEVNNNNSHRYIFYLPELKIYLWQISMPQYFEVDTNAPVLPSVTFENNRALNHWAFVDSPIMNEENLYVSSEADPNIHSITVGRSFGFHGNFRLIKNHSTFLDKQLYSVTVDKDKVMVFNSLHKKALIFEKESDIDNFKNGRKFSHCFNRDSIINMVKSELAKWPDYDHSYCRSYVFEQYSGGPSYNKARSVELPFYFDDGHNTESYFYDPSDGSYYAVKFISKLGCSHSEICVDNNPDAIKLLDFNSAHYNQSKDELYLYFTPIKSFELVSKFIVGSLDDTKTITLKPISEFLDKFKRGKKK